MTENNWILTDVDCMQYIRDTGNGTLECIQIQEIIPEEEYAVVMDRIEPLAYSVEDILAVIKPYGYDNFDILIRMHGKDTPRVVAECLFESISCFQRENYRAIGPYEYCRFWIHGFLYEWEERHGFLRDGESNVLKTPCKNGFCEHCNNEMKGYCIVEHKPCDEVEFCDDFHDWKTNEEDEDE